MFANKENYSLLDDDGGDDDTMLFMTTLNVHQIVTVTQLLHSHHLSSDGVCAFIWFHFASLFGSFHLRLNINLRFIEWHMHTHTHARHVIRVFCGTILIEHIHNQSCEICRWKRNQMKRKTMNYVQLLCKMSLFYERLCMRRTDDGRQQWEMQIDSCDDRSTERERGSE